MNQQTTLQKRPRPFPFSLPLSLQVFFCALIGLGLGLLVQFHPSLGQGLLRLDKWGQLGLLVIKFLRTLATPLIFLAIVDSVTRLGLSFRQGGKLLLVCLVNVSFAMILGLSLMNSLQPGKKWVGLMEDMKNSLQVGHFSSKKSEDPEAPEVSLDLVSNVSYYIPSSFFKPFFYNNVISLVLLVLASIMAGAGVAGVPEAGLIVLPLVLNAVGLPQEMVITFIPLILPVDWIIARVRSAVNVMSDMTVSILVDRKWGGKDPT